MRRTKFRWVGVVLATWLLSGCIRTTDKRSADAGEAKQLAIAITHRKVYRYSVVPGGVYTPEELARSRRVDAVVALHYADFGSDAKLMRLPHDELMYVSYRKGTQVFWTKAKHRVCEGEAVLKDSKNNLARTRCGNRLSKIPQMPVALKEPTEPVLNDIDFPLQTLPDGPLSAANFEPPPIPAFVPSGAAPVSNAPAIAPAVTGAAPGGFGPGPPGFFPSPLFPVVGGVGGVATPTTPKTPTTPMAPTTPTVPPTTPVTPVAPVTPGGPTVVPEPAVAELLLGGLLLAAGLRLRRAAS